MKNKTIAAACCRCNHGKTSTVCFPWLGPDCTPDIVIEKPAPVKNAAFSQPFHCKQDIDMVANIEERARAQRHLCTRSTRSDGGAMCFYTCSRAPAYFAAGLAYNPRLLISLAACIEYILLYFVKDVRLQSLTLGPL